MDAIVKALGQGVTNPPRRRVNDCFRRMDGSWNSYHYPHMGASGSKYQFTVKPTRDLMARAKKLPSPAAIFDKLLSRKAGGGFKPHPSNLNATLSHAAVLVTHDLFWSDSKDPSINLHSSHLDMQFLYGRSDEEKAKSRNHDEKAGPGEIIESFIADSRLALQPAGAIALIAVFAREHNRCCRELLKRYPERFSDEKTRDELLYQTARAIVIGQYVYIILGDYLSCLIGSDQPLPLDPLKATHDPTSGNTTSLEFNYIYRWHPIIPDSDEKDIEARFVEAKGNMSLIKHALLPAQGLQFAPGQVEEELGRSLKSPLGAFSPLNTPDFLKPVDCDAISKGRKLGLCTFNEFREHFGKPKLKKWSDFNSDPKIQKALSELYETPDDVELYPGGIIEEGSGNSGLRVPYTYGRVILVDAITLIKNDRFLTDDLNPQVVTDWGMETIHNAHVKDLIERNTTIKLDHLNGKLGRHVFDLVK